MESRTRRLVLRLYRADLKPVTTEVEVRDGETTEVGLRMEQ